MRRLLLAILLCAVASPALALYPFSMATAPSLMFLPTTTYGAETAITTSASSFYTGTYYSILDYFNSNPTQPVAHANESITSTNVSPLSVKTLLSGSAASAKVFMHTQTWFVHCPANESGSPPTITPSSSIHAPTCANHIDNGNSSGDVDSTGAHTGSLTYMTKLITWLKSIGVDGMIMVWSGPSAVSPTNPTILSNEYSIENALTVADSLGGFQIAVNENGGPTICQQFNPGGCTNLSGPGANAVTNQVIYDINYALANFATHSSYLTLNGKPVIFSFGLDNAVCDANTFDQAHCINWTGSTGVWANLTTPVQWIFEQECTLSTWACPGYTGWTHVGTTTPNNYPAGVYTFNDGPPWPMWPIRSGSPYSATPTFTNSSAVIGVGTSINAGEQVRFMTTGALPSPLIAGKLYWVVSPSGNNISVATTQGGSPLTITTAGMSGTQTVFHTPNPYTSTPTFTNGSAVIGIGTTQSPGQSVMFTTTGVLPSPLVAGQTYWVVSPSGNNISVATSPFGSPLTITTAGMSGTPTISYYSCPSFWTGWDPWGHNEAACEWTYNNTEMVSGSLAFEPQVAMYTVFKGFDDTIVNNWTYSTSSDIVRYAGQQCGLTWLQQWQMVNQIPNWSATNSVGVNIPKWIGMQTLDDYEEGSELETGISNCLTLAPTISGQTVTFNPSFTSPYKDGVNGNTSTISSYSVYVSQVSTAGGGSTPMQLVASGISNTATSYTIPSGILPHGTYYVQVKAIGQPMIKNVTAQASTPMTY